MRHQLTQHDINKMKQEIEHRKVVVRKELLEHVKEARAHGDLSENFEYHAAKKARNQNESRIRYLERMLKNATIIDDSSSQDEVGLNNTVTLYYPDDECEETYKLTTSIRSNSLDGRLDMESPLGQAILGHKVGDVVTVKLPDFSYDVEIKKIDKSTTDDDDIRSF